MDQKNTVNSLLVGSEKSESHPGTQAKPSSDAQGPGCPSYSGGGKDPFSLSKTLTTTHASPLDLTALAAAIPDSAPSHESAWTLVAPKQKKKNRKDKRRTDKRTDNTDRHKDDQTDDRSDRPTDSRDPRGRKRIDSDCQTGNVIDPTREGKGGSGGMPPPSGDRPSMNTSATLGRQEDKFSRRQGPGPIRDRQIPGVSSSNTAGAGQTEVKDRETDGGQTDPEGNPIQTRGATGPSCSTNTRTPTTTKPETNTTNAHNLPSSRARPRSRKRNRGKPTDRPDNPGTSHNNKRDRRDDTISPRGEHKRPRTDYRQHRDGTGSYARAAVSHLSVAVTTTPRVDLTQTEANAIQGQIQKAIFAACIAPVAPGQTRYAPAFEGKAFLSEGVLKMWCVDDRALNWLQAQVPTLTPPRDGVRLTVIRQTEIPIRVRSGLFVPDYDGDIGTLHQVLSAQNPWYGVSRWTLFSHQKTTSNPPGVFLILGVPSEEIPSIVARGRKVAYSTGTIYIRFFTNEGLSDVPPGQNPVPENRGEPDVEAMEVAESTDLNPPTPEPSVSAVLENIEAVLTSSRVEIAQKITTPNTLDIDAPADQESVRRADRQ